MITCAEVGASRDKGVLAAAFPHWTGRVRSAPPFRWRALSPSVTGLSSILKIISFSLFWGLHAREPRSA